MDKEIAQIRAQANEASEGKANDQDFQNLATSVITLCDVVNDLKLRLDALAPIKK